MGEQPLPLDTRALPVVRVTVRLRETERRGTGSYELVERLRVSCLIPVRTLRGATSDESRRGGRRIRADFLV